MEIDISWYKKKSNHFPQSSNTNLQTLKKVIQNCKKCKDGRVPLPNPGLNPQSPSPSP